MIRHVLGHGLRTVVLGLVVGIVLALAAAKFVTALLYGVAPNDPGVLAVIAAVLLGAAAAAAALPAWRAARVDPVSALRAD